MTNVGNFPFQLINVIFINLKLFRAPDIPKEPIKFVIENKNMDFQDKLQVNLRVRSSENSPVNIDLELIGFFEYLDDNSKKDKDLINEFIQKQAILMLWPYIQQMIKVITSQMGIEPINLPFQLTHESSKDTIEGCA